MKFLNYILFYISVGLLSLTACWKSTELSEADYKYNPVNVLTISTDTNAYDVFQFDSLYIKTNIVESKPSNSTFEYEWKALSNEKATLLSTDRDLRISVGLAPGSYNLQYTVTDKSNGLQFNKLYNLKVNSGFNSGWFVTHNKNNKAGLSFIRTDKTVFSAPAEDANNKSFSGKALRTYYAFLNNQQNYASILYFTTEGVYRFDPNNFAQVGDTQTILPTVSSFTSIPNNNASLIYEFPSSAKVTSLVMDKSTGNVGKTLAVGVMNNGDGEVYFFNINTLGWFTNSTFDSSFKGFGEVIHLSKKF